MKALYTAFVTSVGGRNGRVESSDGLIKLDLAAPPVLGGNGKGSNPEQLFAAGYAACFAGAMDFLAQQQKLETGEITIQSQVAIGPDDAGLFTLEVQFDVQAAALDQPATAKLVSQAHEICPYSRATRGNINVRLKAQGKEV